MKLSNIQSYFSSLPFITLISIFIVQACLLQPTLSPDHVEQTAIAAPICTLADSWDNLLINFTGEAVTNFLVKVEDNSGNVGAIQCFEDKQPISSNGFSTPEPEIINQMPPILGLCNSNNGYFSIDKWHGDTERITVQCFEPKSENFLNYSRCWHERKGVTFASFAPNELTISVYWNGKSKTRTVRPVYENFYPNGKACEPVYKKSTMNMELP